MENTANDGVCERLGLAEELDVRTIGLGRVDEVGFGEFRGEFLGKLLWLLLDLESSDLEDGISEPGKELTRADLGIV